MAKLPEVQDLKIEFRTPLGILHAVNGISYDVEKGGAKTATSRVLNPPTPLVRGASRSSRFPQTGMRKPL